MFGIKTINHFQRNEIQWRRLLLFIDLFKANRCNERATGKCFKHFTLAIRLISFHNEAEIIFENQRYHFIGDEIAFGPLRWICIEFRPVNECHEFAAVCWFHLEAIQIAWRFIFCVWCDDNWTARWWCDFNGLRPRIHSIQAIYVMEAWVEETNCKIQRTQLILVSTEIYVMHNILIAMQSYSNPVCCMHCSLRSRDKIWHIENQISRYDNFDGMFDTSCINTKNKKLNHNYISHRSTHHWRVFIYIHLFPFSISASIL